MVAALDWCFHTTHDRIWFDSYFGFHGPLRQYFSLYRVVSQRERKKRKKIAERTRIPRNAVSRLPALFHKIEVNL